MFFRFFDRTPVSRDRDCHGLTEISEISCEHQQFCIHQRFDHFECGGQIQTGWYSIGEIPPIKAGHWGTIPHLESTCTLFNTTARRRTWPSVGPERSQQLQILPRRRTWPSAGPERSQQLQILPSLTVRHFFSWSAYFSCCANIGGCLVFPVRQNFCSPQYFSIHQGFGIRQRVWMRQGFGIR